MKYLTAILCFLFGVTNAQTTTIDSLKYEVKYQFSFQRDSTDIYSKRQEETLVQIGKNKSLFISTNMFKRDSMMTSSIINKQPMLNLAGAPKTTMSYKIVKNRDTKTITYYDNFLSTYLDYDEEMKLNWELTNEVEKIDQLNCKIAYINYAGRRYKTWYSTDIAIPEGPYKFSGLPGLIIKMEDTKGFYKFELISFKDVSSDKQLITISSKHDKSKKVSKQDFLKAKRNFYDNFGQQLSQLGITLGQDTLKAQQEKRKKQNNPIELTE